MTAKTILLIDDDTTLLELLSDYVSTAGYRTLAASNGPEGIRLAGEEHLDLVVLDVMMPGMDGWEVCRQLRAHSRVPIILLTAKGDEIDKLRGFRLGVDDYVTKPFSFAEMVARITAVLVRSDPLSASQERIRSGSLVIELDHRRATLEGQVVDLTPTEYRLLEALARNPGRTIPTERLLIETWGSQYAGEIEYVKRYIWALRKKIELDPGNPMHIITVRGFGYRFE